MSNPWASAHCASALFPSTLAAGEEPSLIPPRPPDPPDPASASPRLSLAHYPPLSPNNPTARALASPSSNTKARSITSPSSANQLPSPTDTEMDYVDPSSVSETRSDLPRSVTTVDSNPTTENFTTLPPKSSSPLHTNKASNLPSNPKTGDSNSPSPSFPEKQTEPLSAPFLASPPLAQRSKTQPTPPKPSLVERIRRFEDKTLSRLAPVTLSASGRPSVLIPDAVFQKGADLHKDFIVCCFNGRPPHYSQIQSQPTPKPGPTSNSTPSASTVSFSPPVTDSPSSSFVPPPISSKSPSPQTFKHLSLPVLPDFSSLQSPPNPRRRQSLKRSRSDPSLSPPNSSLLQSHVPPNPIQTSEPPPNSSLFLTLPSSSSSSFDPNPFSILATNSSFSKGEFPPTS
ncbi:hypothetical protein IGI04_003502 [Brassica rapa subsp. trilocularis]|uniref:VQ domain-containing protein n=1 Tax=Brassica rapa subsp. trilocularis TaxID=1813537 RepID=A0ABQ7NYK4_BRACM|nr:hypothetical protein IGI04_003502 [Brassica rapa subsp. trilocularis]